MYYILDSNVYLGAFLPEHIFQEESTHLLKSIEWKVLLPYIILSEILTILTYKVNKKLAQEFFSFIENDWRFLIIDTNIEESLIFWNWIQKNIAHADSELIYIAMKYNAKLISYDKELMKVYEKL